MKRDTKIKLLSAIIIIGFSVAVFYHYILGSYLGNGEPLNSFLFPARDRFNDFFNMVQSVKGLDPYNYEIKPNSNIYFAYPPFGEIFFYPFTLIGNKFLALFIYFAIFLAVWMIFVNKNFSQSNRVDNAICIFSISFLTYPFLFAVDRANLELYTFLLLCGFIFFYNASKNHILLLSLLSLSLAIAMKAFPAIFLILLVKQKRWKEILMVIAGAILITFFSLLCFQGSILENIYAMKRNQDNLSQAYIIGSSGWAYGGNLFGLLKVIIAFLVKITNLGVDFIDKKQLFMNWVSMATKLYSLLSFTLLLLTSIYIIAKEKKMWKMAALLVIAINFLIPLSGDYRLLSIFIPLAFFVNEEKPSKYDLIYVILFGLLLIPKNYFIIPQMTAQGLSISVILSPLLMLILGCLIIKEGYNKENVIRYLS